MPVAILSDMFAKAAKLAHSGKDIFPVPGEDYGKLYNVSGKKTVHQIKHETTARGHTLSCSNNCVRFNGFKICAHTLALAEHLKVLQAFITGYKK